MKKYIASFLLGISFFSAFPQSAPSQNTLLWKITGKDLKKPSYLFGTIHMMCADDIQISANLRSAIQEADRVYLELDMDNIFEMLAVMNKMKMRNDTTLEDLLTPAEYSKVKDFFSEHSSMIPFSTLETYKPMLAASTLMQASLDCDKQVAMEQLVMKEAKANGKGVRGLETMAYQISIFDSIPYKTQAKQLLTYIENYGTENNNKEFEELTRAYRNQELDKMEAITRKEELADEYFADLLLYRRNVTWAKKLAELMPGYSLVVAVGAGHLPGEKGVINLLRKAGYKVEPVANDMIRKPNLKEM